MRVLYKNPDLLKNKNNPSSFPSLSMVEHLVEVDEIELEPIPLTDEAEKQIGAERAYEDTYRMLSNDDQTVQENIDEIIYSHGSFASLLGQQAAPRRPQGLTPTRGGIYGGRGMAPNMLSSIPEESSIREMDINSSSIVTDQNMPCINNSYEKLDKDMQSLIVPQSSQEGVEESEDANGNSSIGSKKNHRRFGKNATKFLGSNSNYDNQIKTLEEVTSDLDDLRVQTPPVVEVGGKKGMSPEAGQNNLPSSIQFGNLDQDPKGSTTSKDSKKNLRLSYHHSKKNSRQNSQNITIEENEDQLPETSFSKRDNVNLTSMTQKEPQAYDE